MRSTYLLALVLPVLLLAPAALAGPQVPEVAQSNLPVAGTCAPLPTDHVTWVTVGEVDYYRVGQDQRDLTGAELYELLMIRSREAAETGARHDVWIAANRRRSWGQVVQVMDLCQQTGLFRVGLQVQAESGEGVLGFPLFLPGGAPPTGSAGVARLLEVRLEKPRANPIQPPRASHPDHVFAAAQKAVAQFGPVVAEASIPREVEIQEAVRVIDLLYRAGCAGVKLPYRVMRRQKMEPVVQIWVQNTRLLLPDAPTVQVPPVRARAMPWPDSGAAQPGALAMTLEAIPTGDRPATATTRRLLPLPNYAATDREVPGRALTASAASLKDWSDRMGEGLEAVVSTRAPRFPEKLLVRRKRQGMGVDDFFREARRAFPGASDIGIATTRIQAYLFRESTIVGRVDLTVSNASAAPAVVFASWVAGPYPTQEVRLPPAETDPFAAGVPGHLRVWLEGLLAAGRVRGASAIPVASEGEILGQLPTVAHGGVRGQLARRGAVLENLVGWLRATPYDRLLIESTEGSAAVREGSRVAGILRFDLEPEDGELCLSSLVARVAPR